MLTATHTTTEAELNYGSGVFVNLYFTGPETSYAQMTYPDHIEEVIADTSLDEDAAEIWGLRDRTAAEQRAWTSVYFSRWGDYEHSWAYAEL